MEKPLDVRVAESHNQFIRGVDMSKSRRTTIYFNPDLHAALKLKAAESGRTMSDFVNQAVRVSLSEDAIDLEALDVRRKQRRRRFSSFTQDLNKVGY